MQPGRGVLLDDIGITAAARLVAARFRGDAEFSFLAVDVERHVFSTRALKAFGFAPVALARRLIGPSRTAFAAAARRSLPARGATPAALRAHRAAQRVHQIDDITR